MTELRAKQVWVEDGHATQGMWWDTESEGTIRFVRGDVFDELLAAAKALEQQSGGTARYPTFETFLNFRAAIAHAEEVNG